MNARASVSGTEGRRGARARQAPRALHQGVRRARVRALEGHRPPRPQAGEHHDRAAQRGLPDGLGHRAADRRRRDRPSRRASSCPSGATSRARIAGERASETRSGRRTTCRRSRPPGKNPELDGRSDQYAMGLILQECVTLKPAVDGAIAPGGPHSRRCWRSAIPSRSATGRAPCRGRSTPSSAGPRACDPEDRYPSVRELADDVRRYLRGEPVLALPEGALRRAGRWLGRHRMATLTLLLAIGLVGAGGTIGALLAGQARIEAQHARELRVSQMAAESAIQTQLVDRDLTRYEAALAELVGAAQIVLSKLPASDAAALLRGELRRQGDRAARLRPVEALRPRRERARPAHLAGPRRRARAASSRSCDRSRCSGRPSARSSSGPRARTGAPCLRPRSARSSPTWASPPSAPRSRCARASRCRSRAWRAAAADPREAPHSSSRRARPASSGAPRPRWTASRSSRRAPRSTTSGAPSAAWPSSRSR